MNLLLFNFAVGQVSPPSLITPETLLFYSSWIFGGLSERNYFIIKST